MAKFYGMNNEVVFDSNRDCVLCKFSKGELTTTNKYIIERLTELGYKREEPAKPASTETSGGKTTKTKKG